MGTIVFVWTGLLASAALTFAQTDEIQVYDAEIENPGVFSLMVHNNFTPIGRKNPAFPGAIIPNNSVNGAAEWSFGVKPWFEQGLYLPVYSFYSAGRGATVNGFKIRELFVRPNARDHSFFYGINFEFSVNANYWESRRISSEIRSILGLHLHRVDLIYNPIFDTDYTGGPGNLQFAPAGRVAYNFNNRWAIAGEEYEDFGPLRHFVPANEQFHEIWAVMDHSSRVVNVETGFGVGVTGGTDRLTFKLMLSREFNPRPQP